MKTSATPPGPQEEPPSLNRLLETSHKVGAIAASAAAEGERNRRVSDAVVSALADSGLLKILQSRRFGGYELGFPAFVRVCQMLAQYDVSTSWIYGIFSIHGWWGNFVEPELQEELWGGNPERVFVDSFAPTGTAKLADGGHRLSGRWSFLSGLPWAEWAAVGAVAPLERGRPPEYLMFFVPRREYRVIDDWYTIGLRGSASASIEISEAVVPRHRIFRMGHMMKTGEAAGLSSNQGPLFHVQIVPGLTAALVPQSVGGAQAVAHRFRERAISRVPLFQQRQAELVLSQATLAEAMVSLDTLEQLLYRYADELMALGRQPEPASPRDRARLFAWRAYIARRSREVIASLADMSGARSIFEDEPMQRFWRDVFAMGQHVGLNYEAGLRTYGRTLLGLEPEAVLY